VTVATAAALDARAGDAVLGLLARVAAHDGVAAVGEVGLLGLRAASEQPGGGAGAVHLLARAEDGTLAGYGWTDGRSAELAVDPGHRRRGPGTALLEALRAAYPGVAVGAHGDLPAARALAARLGMVTTRELWHMLWEPSVNPTVPSLAEGLAVRSFRGEADGPDGRAWVTLNARIFTDHPEQGRLSSADLSRRMAEPWFDREAFLLVTDPSDVVVAYLWIKSTGDTDEVYVLGVAPEHERRGIAAHLLARAQQATRARGGRALTLYVEGDNLTAVRSYVRAGFRRGSVDLQYSFPGGPAPGSGAGRGGSER